MEPVDEETHLCTSLIWAAATALHCEPAALMTILMQLDVQPTCGHANQWVLQNNGGNGNSIPRSNFLLWDSLHFLQPLRAHGSIKGAILGNTHQTTPVFRTICFTTAHISSRLTDISSDMPHGPSATTCPYRTITSQRKLITSLMMPRFEYYIDLLLSILPPPIQAPHTPSRLFNYHTLGWVFLPYSINYLLRLVNQGQTFSYAPRTNHGPDPHYCISWWSERCHWLAAMVGKSTKNLVSFCSVAPVRSMVATIRIQAPTTVQYMPLLLLLSIS